MYYSGVKYNDIANGSGVRTVLFVSGCRNHCKDCFQPETWSFTNGLPFDDEIQQKMIDSLEPAYISGLTLLGGDPFEQENQRDLLPFVRKVKQAYPNKSLWAYTGYVLEDLLPGGRRFCEVTEELLGYVDVLVDGPFVTELKNITLKFKGSENQRVIDMNVYRSTGEIKECM